MKKFRGTKYAYIATSCNPLLDKKFDNLEKMVLMQQARIEELSLRIQKLLGLEPEE